MAPVRVESPHVPVGGRRGTPRLTHALLCGLLLLLAHSAGAQQAKVAGTLHNLSVSGPGEVRSQTETEICKFCHIPHSAVLAEPLWGHTLSEVRDYAVPELRYGAGVAGLAPQPDGSSRLCLSCHDGTVALGDIGGSDRPVRVENSPRLRPGRRGYLGTDLSGSHPISFVVPDSEPRGIEVGWDMGLRPLSAIQGDPDVRLDQSGKMQCTTCHDPHSDRHYVPGRVPRFWVKTSVEEVCLTCHELR